MLPEAQGSLKNLLPQTDGTGSSAPLTVRTTPGTFFIDVGCQGEKTIDLTVAPIGNFQVLCGQPSRNGMDLQEAHDLQISVVAAQHVTWALRVQE